MPTSAPRPRPLCRTVVWALSWAVLSVGSWSWCCWWCWRGFSTCANTELSEETTTPNNTSAHPTCKKSPMSFRTFMETTQATAAKTWSPNPKETLSIPIIPMTTKTWRAGETISAFTERKRITPTTTTIITWTPVGRRYTTAPLTCRMSATTMAQTATTCLMWMDPWFHAGNGMFEKAGELLLDNNYLKSTRKCYLTQQSEIKCTYFMYTSCLVYDFILMFYTWQTAVIYCRYVLDGLLWHQDIKGEVYMVYDHRVDLHKENKSAKIKLHCVRNHSSYHIAHDC